MFFTSFLKDNFRSHFEIKIYQVQNYQRDLTEITIRLNDASNSLLTKEIN